MQIAGREYPTPLVVGGVAGVLALVAGQKLLGSRNADAGPADPAAAGQLRPGASDGELGQNDLGQFPAAGAGQNEGQYDWWDDGGGSASLPPAPTPINDPGPPLPPTPVAPPPVVVPPHPTPAPSGIPAGAVARVTFRSGTYRTARVSGSTFVGYGPNHAGGFSAYAARAVALNHNGTKTTWFKILSGGAKGLWFYRYDARITWRPI